MAGRRGNKVWLCQQLQRALQWDADTAEALVEAVAAAGDDRREVEALVDGFTDGNAAAKRLVQQFCGAAASPAQQAQQRAAAAGGGRAAAAAAVGGGRGPRAVELPPPIDRPQPALSLGRNIPVTVKPGRQKAAAAAGSSAGGSAAAAKALAKPVVNCLACGKIFDCREASEEARRFLASGGTCSFCGRRVLLRYADGTTNVPADGGAAPDTQTLAADGAQPAASPAADDSAAAAAAALRDRLVQYDREAAKRTAVFDDQADYFEIDANAWLTDEERAVLKQRQREAAEAEEARRRRVTVTVDLLGRQVVLDAAAGGDASASQAQLEARLEAARSAAAAREAAAATAAEAAQGGGGAAPAALAAVEERLQSLRITVNPSMAARHFVFLPQQAPQQAGCSGGGKGQRQKEQQRRLPAAAGISRLQHDDPFDVAFGAEAGSDAMAVG